MKRPEPIVGSTHNMTIYVEWLEAQNAKLREAAQAVVDGLFLPVAGDYHYSQQDTDLIDTLKAALEGEE
jgi:hypothetical protein